MPNLFDQPRMRDHDLKDLYDGRPFFLLKAETHPVKSQEFGDGEAVDLFVRDESGESENGDVLYSGFSAGILRQVKQAQRGDFPCWARIERKQLSANRSTTILVPSAEGEAGERVEPSDEDIPF